MKSKKIPIQLLGFLLCISVLHLHATPIQDTSIIARTVSYKTVQGIPIKADLYISGTGKGVQPVIVWLHGGGLIFGSRKDLPDEQLRLYLKSGFAVFAIDYRLAPESKLPDIVQDVLDALGWIRRNATTSLLDSNRVILVGHSGGAYLALMAAAKLPHPPAAIVSFYGYGEIQADWYTQPSPFYSQRPVVSLETLTRLTRDSILTNAPANERFDIYLYSRQQGLWPFMVTNRNPAVDSAFFADYEPIKQIDRLYPPVLLIHGKKDNDVPYEQSVKLDRVLSANKVKHRFITLENSGHVFDLFEGGFTNSAIREVFREVVDFMMTEVRTNR